MMHRRRLIQMAAFAPAVSFGPLLTRVAGATGEGDTVGFGATVAATGREGLSLSWLGDQAEVAVVRGLVDDSWSDPVTVGPDHGHGPEDPSGRVHGPAVLMPGASVFEITPTADARDLRQHPILSPPRSLELTAADPTFVEPIPGLKIIERTNWTAVERRDTIDCVLRSSVYGLGCRADVGARHAIVHHTVNINDYAMSDVPALLHGIQSYHMHTRGWDDIAYNFVLDRWGRIWHTREGNIAQPITGGHTTGLNAESVGVAVLGDFTALDANQAIVDSLALLLGWKLSLHGVDPLGHTFVRSSGGDYAKGGEMVDLDNITGHRDNQITGCPGNGLYPKLDEIRAGAAELVPVFGHLVPSYGLDDIRTQGWAMDRFDPATAVEIDIVVDGEPATTLTADAAVDGLDDDYPEGGNQHGFDHLVPIAMETTSIVVTARAGDGRTAELMNLKLFATFIDVEPDRFFAGGVWFLREKGLTQGTQPGLFEPMDEVTRAQMATFLHRFMDLPEAAGVAPFADIDSQGFYADAVNWLYEAGITTGTGPEEFSPHAWVTRAQMATFLWRLCGEIPPTRASPFEDVPAGSFYTDAVAWLFEVEITKGVLPTVFAPDAPVTRGEMATFLHRLATTAAAWTATSAPSVVEI